MSRTSVARKTDRRQRVRQLAAPPTRAALVKLSPESPQATIDEQAGNLACAAVHLADAVEAFAGEQWRYHRDLFAELRKTCGDTTVSALFASGARGQEFSERNTTLSAASWYLHDRARELWDRGTELSKLLKQEGTRGTRTR